VRPGAAFLLAPSRQAAPGASRSRSFVSSIKKCGSWCVLEPHFCYLLEEMRLLARLGAAFLVAPTRKTMKTHESE